MGTGRGMGRPGLPGCRGGAPNTVLPGGRLGKKPATAGTRLPFQHAPSLSPRDLPPGRTPIRTLFIKGKNNLLTVETEMGKKHDLLGRESLRRALVLLGNRF